ncbi:MAG: hypothetical protein LUE16_00765 [Lachnospiraceae bacterium]|nr:hypothetical protein [Lachnospiraceae bacterium]
MADILMEENGVYCLDCTNAVWAADQMHQAYRNAGLHINDVDFVVESADDLFLVEYKNASIPGGANPSAFQPLDNKKVDTAAKKFFDSLHYLALLNKTKPVKYVYILEYPNGDVVTRKRLRNLLKEKLPFVLQKNIGNGKRLIESVDVVSIDEWNDNETYGRYPLIKAE